MNTPRNAQQSRQAQKRYPLPNDTTCDLAWIVTCQPYGNVLGNGK
jgi:hypothetical protein